MIKQFKLFELANLRGMNDVEIYYDDSDYVVIFLVRANQIVGFVNNGMQTTLMEQRNIHTIGSIYGPGFGDLLYALCISKFGPIVPSGNVSDQAKEAHKRRMKDGNFKIYRITGIGYYGKDEDYLNNIYDLDDETKQFLKSKIKKCEDINLVERMLQMFFAHKDEYYNHADKYYTVGKSKYKG